MLRSYPFLFLSHFHICVEVQNSDLHSYYFHYCASTDFFKYATDVTAISIRNASLRFDEFQIQKLYLRLTSLFRLVENHLIFAQSNTLS